MEGYLASILMFGGNFNPRGWAFCNGQSLPISSNQALFSLLGTTYGGNGQTNFQLPDMRGRVPMHPGHGPGLSEHALGEKGGVETVALDHNQIPSRPGQIPAGSGSMTAVNTPNYSEPHTNLQPYLCVNFIICLQGIFPSRD
jgi:microcystin-dependent protein